MPAPTHDDIIVPEGFDPAAHCGGMRRGARTACMLKAGYKTDHLGQGRCYLHGGKAGGVKHGMRSSQVNRPGLLDRAKEIRDSDELLTLDNEIAYLKAFWEAKIREHDQAYRAYLLILEKIENGDYDRDELPKISIPDLDADILDKINRLVTAAYNMRFAKRFSIPITELEGVVNQIRVAFLDVVKKYNLPMEAAAEFAERLAALQIGSGKVDYQLDRAGGMRGRDQTIELNAQGQLVAAGGLD